MKYIKRLKILNINEIHQKIKNIKLKIYLKIYF